MIINGKSFHVPSVRVQPPVGVGGSLVTHGQLVGSGDNGDVATAGAIGAGVIAIGVIANLALIGGLVYIGYRAGKAAGRGE